MNEKSIPYLPVKFRYVPKKGTIEGEMEIYFRVKGKKALQKKVESFRPYIYKEIRSIPKPDPNAIVYTNLVTGQKCQRVYGSRTRIKEMLDINRASTAEGDLSPEKRFVVDSYYNVEFPGEIKPRVFFFDIETEIVGDDVPRFDLNKAEITAFTIYDTYTDRYYLCALIPEAYLDREKAELKEEILDYLKEYNIKVSIRLYTNPVDLLESLIKIFENNPPDIVTSWNSPFDIPYVVRKIYDHAIDLAKKEGTYKKEDEYNILEAGLRQVSRLSPFKEYSFSVKKALQENSRLDADNIIPGISVIDDLELYKKYTDSELISYSLNYVSITELGADDSKLQYDTDFDTLYKKNFIHFCKYNVQDVRVMVLIENKKKLIDLAIAVRNLTKANYEHIFTELNLVDYLSLMKAERLRQNGILTVLPTSPLGGAQESYLGAFVKPTITGRFRYVGDLDYKSMYPSMYDTWNLSVETIVGEINGNLHTVNYLFDKYLRKKYAADYGSMNGYESSDAYLDEQGIAKMLLPKWDYSKEPEPITIKIRPRILYEKIVGDKEFNNVDELAEWCFANNYALMANGLIVDQNKDAFLGSLAGEIMDLRDEYKVAMKNYAKQKNYLMAAILNTSQSAVKVINNSIYGALANRFFRLFDLSLAESITSTGQCIIKSSTYLVNQSINKYIKDRDLSHQYKDIVLTNDTDSIIMTVEDIIKEKVPDTVEEYEKIVNLINTLARDVVNTQIKVIATQVFFVQNIKPPKFRLYIKNEWLAVAALMAAKKCYALDVVYKEGYAEKAFVVKGMTLKKSSTPRVARDYLTTLVKKILAFEPKEKIDEYVVDSAHKIKTATFDELAYPTSVGGISKYDKTIPIHVRGAQVFNKYFAKSNRDRIANEKVKYLYVKKWKTNNTLNINKEYVLSIPTNNKEYWDILPDIIEPDYNKLKFKLIEKPTTSLYNILNWKMPNLNIERKKFAGFGRVKRA